MVWPTRNHGEDLVGGFTRLEEAGDLETNAKTDGVMMSMFMAAKTMEQQMGRKMSVWRN